MILNRFVFASPLFLMTWAALLWGNSLGQPAYRSHVSGVTCCTDSTETTVSPATQTTDSTVRSYAIVDRGGLSLLTSGGGATARVTYTKIQPDSGSTTPSGVAIFGFTSNGVLVSETGVPAAPLVQSGRIFVVFSGSLDTGLAIANPNDQEVSIDFFFTDTTLAVPDFGTGTMTLAPGRQFSGFMSQAPFSLPDGTVATFTFSSSLPISVVALRGRVTSRGDFLTSSLPITPVGSTSTERVYLPHFAAGGGWTTDIILVNPAESTITGILGFINPGTEGIPGQQTAISVNGQFPQSLWSYAISAKGSAVLRTTESVLSAVRVGSVQINPEGDVAPSAQVIFSLVNADGVVVSEAGVPAAQTGNVFRMYAEASGTPFTPGAIQSGVAIRNIGFVNATVNLELTDLEGNLIGMNSLVVPASGQRALFVDELFTAPFKGVLRVFSSEQTIAMTALRGRTNERSEFLTTTTVPTNEAAAATTAEFLFPHLVDGGGWSTQTILFSGIAGQVANGTMRFFGTDGKPFEISLQ